MVIEDDPGPRPECRLERAQDRSRERQAGLFDEDELLQDRGGVSRRRHVGLLLYCPAVPREPQPNRPRLSARDYVISGLRAMPILTRARAVRRRGTSGRVAAVPQGVGQRLETIRGSRRQQSNRHGAAIGTFRLDQRGDCGEAGGTPRNSRIFA